MASTAGLPTLKILLYRDLWPGYRSSFEPLFQALSGEFNVTIHDVSESDRFAFRHLNLKENDRLWILASNWKEAVEWLGIRSSKNVFLSVLGAHDSRKLMPTLFLRKILPSRTPPFQWITHSPLSYRYFQEIEEVPKEHVHYIPMSLPLEKKSVAAKVDNNVVGVLTPFNVESNLNYYLNVAHYCLQKNPNLRFEIVGSGPLYQHYTRLAQDLELHRVHITEAREVPPDFNPSVLLYSPLRNFHFFPILWAASKRIPVLSSHVLGAEDFIEDGNTGFLVSPLEVKSMAELTLRLTGYRDLATNLGEKLFQRLSSRFHSHWIANKILRLFRGEVVWEQAA